MKRRLLSILLITAILLLSASIILAQGPPGVPGPDPSADRIRGFVGEEETPPGNPDPGNPFGASLRDTSPYPGPDPSDPFDPYPGPSNMFSGKWRFDIFEQPWLYRGRR